jgi:hypothetical protein
MLRGLAHDFSNGRESQAKECSDLGIAVGARCMRQQMLASVGCGVRIRRLDEQVVVIGHLAAQ